MGDVERTVGIEGFLTDTPALGGRIKAEAEDFVVEEIPAPLPATSDGRWTIATVRVRNWETNRLVRQLARTLRISRMRIGFAGTKDRRAVTTQRLSFQDVPPEALRSLRIKDVEVLDAFRSSRPLEMGDLVGNRFAIVIRDMPLSKEEIGARAGETARQLQGFGGFPNFFGVQRFGSVRPITHVVGRHIVHGEFIEAVDAYVANPIEGEDEESYEARLALKETGDVKAALKEYPRAFGFEKAILSRLAERPGEHVWALQALPWNLLLMFVHAYQSYLFNTILSERMRAGLPIHEPVEGDIVLAARPDGRPNRDRQIKVEAGNLPKVATRCRAGKAWVTGVLFGSESEFAGGRPGEVERLVVDSERLGREDFVVPAIPRLTTKGARRELLAPLGALEWDAGDGTLALRFFLTPGCYATSLLREFLKTGPS